MLTVFSINLIIRFALFLTSIPLDNSPLSLNNKDSNGIASSVFIDFFLLELELILNIDGLSPFSNVSL